MQNANNDAQQGNATTSAQTAQPAVTTSETGTAPTNTAATSVKDVSKVAEQKAAELGSEMKNQVQNVGQQASQQLQNLGQAGVSQMGAAMGKAFTSVTEQKPNQPPVNKDEKTYATIAYIPFVAIISIIIKPDSAYVRLHSKQGLLLSILFFFGGIFAAIVALFGIIGQFLAFLIGLVPLACLVVAIYSMYLAYSGFWWKIPVLGGIADVIPVEMMAKASKENITGQIGIAKTDYDSRAETIKMEKSETTGVAPASMPAQTAQPAAGSGQPPVQAAASPEAKPADATANQNPPKTT